MEKYFFWNNRWFDGSLLCTRFSRPFDLFKNSNITVVEMRSLGWGVEG